MTKLFGLGRRGYFKINHYKANTVVLLTLMLNKATGLGKQVLWIILITYFKN